MEIKEFITKLDMETLLMVGLVGAAAALFSGKFLRRLLLLPFEFLSRKTENKVDDKLVETARQDLGIPDPTIPHEDTSNDRK